MVSHQHKCIFVHIPKTAGTSIEMLINQTPFSGTTHELLKEHANSEYFEEYFKFTFVRNTFERVYSVDGGFEAWQRAELPMHSNME